MIALGKWSRDELSQDECLLLESCLCAGSMSKHRVDRRIVADTRASNSATWTSMYWLTYTGPERAGPYQQESCVEFVGCEFFHRGQTDEEMEGSGAHARTVKRRTGEEMERSGAHARIVKKVASAGFHQRHG